MTRQELIAAVATQYPHLTIKDAEAVVKLIIEAMATSISTGGRVEIRGFGSFNLKQHAPRKGRNPKTGEAVNIPVTSKAYFKPGKELKERVWR